MKQNLCVIGTGYVGMACAIGFAELGFNVVGYDVHADRILGLQRGDTPYNEVGLTDSLRRCTAQGNLTFTLDHDAAVSTADILLVCVGTPARADGSADLSALHACISRLSQSTLADGAIVVIRSTVPPGTTDNVAQILDNKAGVVFAPEFLREGHALEDFYHADRHLVGSHSAEHANRYLILVESIKAPVVLTAPVSAEIAKLASNAFLAMKISFANEIANFADAFNGDGLDVLRAMGHDRRIGSAFLQPGIGFGGPCFDKDLRNYSACAKSLGVPSRLADATLTVNAKQPLHIIDLLAHELGVLSGAIIGIWGLTYKAGTDDTRGTLVFLMIDELIRRGASVKVFDPSVDSVKLSKGAVLSSSALDAAKADALLVLTEWPMFALIDNASIAESLRKKVVVDGRNLLDGVGLAALGVSYRGVGRSFAPLARESRSLPKFQTEAVRHDEHKAAEAV